MKYYFVTYQAKSDSYITYWNEVIDKSPMEFILDVIQTEKNSSNYYINFAITFAMQISVEDYNNFKDKF